MNRGITLDFARNGSRRSYIEAITGMCASAHVGGFTIATAQQLSVAAIRPKFEKSSFEQRALSWTL
jgi:hypothetical protein